MRKKFLARCRIGYTDDLLTIAVVAVLTLSGCRTPDPSVYDNLPPLEEIEVRDIGALPDGFSASHDDLLLGDDGPGTGPDLSAEPLRPSALGADAEPLALPSRNLSFRPTREADTSYNLPMDMTRDIENPEEKVEVKFNFDAESIVNVIQMFSVTLDFQYFVDPGVTGSVTMTIDTEMTRLEAWELFEHILWITGSYASRHFGFINILPFAKMPQERRIFARHDPIPNVNVEMIRLFNTAAADMANLIKPFLTQGATASPITYLNSLLIIEAPPNMNKIRELINRLDVLGESNWPQLSLACYHVDAEVILEELQRILPTLGFPMTTSEKGDGHSIKVIALPRLQILIASAPTVEVLEEVRRWVDILDREESSETEQIFFYDVKYNKAEDLSDQVSVFFTSSSSTSTRRSGRSSTSDTTPQSTATDQSRQRTRRPTQPSTRTRSSSDEAPETVFDIPVTILADGGHNRLVIRTTRRAYLMLEALLRRLDSPPLQVIIKAIIAEINLSKDMQFGFSYTALHRDRDSSIGLGYTPINTQSGELSNPLYQIILENTLEGGGDLAQREILSFIQAVAGKSNTKILSSPQIIAISDEEASINIGNSVPIVTDTLNTGTDDIGNIRNSIQYQDTGTILTVTPHITAKKLVTLDIRQEVSSALPIASDAPIGSPTIQTRVIETSMVVEDNTTVMLGGFIQSDKINNERKLPFLGDIPYVGKLFSYTNNTDSRTELLLVINVKVVDLKTDMDQILARYWAALNSIKDFESDLDATMKSTEPRTSSRPIIKR